MKCLVQFILFVLVLGTPSHAAPVIEIGSRLELFVDEYLTEKFEGTSLKLHEPTLSGVALRFDKPWEGSFSGYITVIQDQGLYRMYYRGIPTSGKDGSGDEVTCYAESTDGITFKKPNLKLFEVHGTLDNNVVLANAAPFSHNFSPFLDTRPGVPAAERYKALAGTSEKGLYGFVSADGLSWKKIRETPLLTNAAFDSQNVGFWSEAENCYVVYFRTWTSGEFRGFRTISRTTSTNWLEWGSFQEMRFGGTPTEHLYTSQTHPYFRAPHIYVALPMRFLPGRKVLTPEQARSLGVDPGYASDCAETVFMSTRGGNRYTRTFMEGFIRPGLDLGNWASRAGLTALGVVQTSPTEMSLYKQAHYAQPTSYLNRYTLRIDGFSSVNAPYRGGEFSTKAIVFSGRELVLNMSTGAAGSIRIEVQDESGPPIPGYALAESDESIGDDLARVVAWKGHSDLSKLAGRAVRLRFVMKDADVYSIQFRN